MDIEEQMDEDAKALAELGYTQELHRGMSAFSNFAVSFSIILILAGCITSYGIALVSGAPSTLVLGWLIVGLMVMAVAMSMADVVRVLPRQRAAWFARLVEGEPAHRDADQLHPALRGAVHHPRLAGPQSGAYLAVTSIAVIGLMVRTTRGRGGGTVVHHPPATPGEPEPGGRLRLRSELMDSLVFRREVEPGACYLAATRTLTGDQRDLLRDVLQAVDQATDPAEHRQADSRLPLAVAAVTESPQLIDAVASVQGTLHSMLIAIPVLKVNIEHSDAQHADIVDAILCGDANRARRMMECHCDDTAALLRGLLG